MASCLAVDGIVQPNVTTANHSIVDLTTREVSRSGSVTFSIHVNVGFIANTNVIGRVLLTMNVRQSVKTLVDKSALMLVVTNTARPRALLV